MSYREVGGFSDDEQEQSDSSPDQLSVPERLQVPQTTKHARGLPKRQRKSLARKEVATDRNGDFSDLEDSLAEMPQEFSYESDAANRQLIAEARQAEVSSGPSRFALRPRRASAKYGPAPTPAYEISEQGSDDDISMYEVADSEEELEDENADNQGYKDEEELEEDCIRVDLEPRSLRASTKRKTERQGKDIDYNQPPMHDNAKIFEDLIKKAIGLGLSDALKELGRPIYVATMCSGTEAPLFALIASAEALEAQGKPALEFRHIFSAEIEFFKQAFIERNFAPEIMFRDIRELGIEGAKVATTAYGSDVEIPKDSLDILIAGFSCKDHSRQNNFQKTLKDNGESGETWTAVYQFSKQRRPKVVLLENVKGKKETWNDLVKEWSDIGYEAVWMYLDTKDYYYPQTRERMYMIAIEQGESGKAASKAAEKWKVTMRALQRRCSSPYEAFIADFPRSAVQYSALVSESRWELSQLRYDQIRSELRLGIGRPCTQWKEDGTKQPLDFADHEWFESRSSREWDAIEVAYLRAAAPSGTDPSSKEIIWDVSQNADRYHDRPGIVPCITPKGQVFSTSRQGPLNGLELMGLQGLPLDRILLARETSAQCQDLAGNAMSTTVIAASQLSAIICACKLFDKSRRGEKQDRPQAPPKVLQLRLNGMGTYEVNVPDPEELDLRSLSEDATSSSRLCSRECDEDFCEAPVRHCSQCGHTACALHAGNPKHVYLKGIEPISRSPTAPDFVLRWTSKLPSRVTFENFSGFESSQTYKNQISEDKLAEFFSQVLANACSTGTSFRRGDFKRHVGSWKVIYKSSGADLVLCLGPKLEWQLYVHCPPELPGNSDLRKLFEVPIVKGRIKDSLLSPEWVILIPQEREIGFTVIGSTETHKSFRNEIGLLDFNSETVPARLHIRQDTKEPLNPKSWREMLTGDYEHLDRCGTASQSLYKLSLSEPPLYLFLDPDPLSFGKDSFCFSYDCSRKQPGEHRETLAILDPEWRPWNEKDHTKKRTVNGKSHGTWERAIDKTMVLVSQTPPISAEVLSGRCILGASCTEVISILRIQARDDDTVFTGDMSDNLWVLEQVLSAPSLTEWQSVGSNFPGLNCLCTPTYPSLKWNVDEGVAKAHEDPKEAAVYERAVKTYTTVFQVEPSNEGKEINIGVSVSLLIHRAAGAFTRTDNNNRSQPERMAWRLLTDQNHTIFNRFPKFELSSNSNDPRFPGKLRLTHQLHGAQPRALEWMRRQEKGIQFTLAETEEAFDSKLGWRLEAIAESDVSIRGGVLADRPSFGKTVTTIALVQSEFEEFPSNEDLVDENVKSDPDLPFRIEIAATLIICPPHIVEQWQEEFKKFLEEDEYVKYEITVIKTFSELKDLDFYHMDATKVVILSWTVLAEEEYIAHLASFTAMPEPAILASAKGVPNSRAYSAWMDRVTKNISGQLHALRDYNDDTKFNENTSRLLQDTLNDPEFQMSLPVKLRHGGQYQDYSSKKAATNKGKKSKHQETEPKELSVPLIHLFRFNRVVVDEYHYLNVGQKEYKKAQGNMLSSVGIKAISAYKRWILSGTPALGSFADVDNIASYLGIRLGRYSNDGPVSKRSQINHLHLETQTSVEEFLSSKNCMSLQWHQARHERAQVFLDTFVRQNEPSLEHIESSESLRAIKLDSVHHAVYMELSQYLVAQRMAMRRQNSKATDRERQLNATLNGAKSGEEALQRCAMSFETDDGKSGLQSLLEIRTGEHGEVIEKLKALMCSLEKYCKKQGKKKATGDEVSISKMYDHFKQDVGREDWLGDADATVEIGSLLKETEGTRGDTVSEAPKLNNDTEAKKTLSQLRKCAKDLMKVTRAKRFICNIQALLSNDQVTCNAPDCVSLDEDPELSVIPTCGHFCCNNCMNDSSTISDNHDTCLVPGCNAAVQTSSYIRFSHIGSQEEQSLRKSFGRKMDKVAELIENIPEHDQVLLFAPDTDGVNKMKQLLDHHNISYLTPSAKDPSRALQRFKNEEGDDTDIKVLILDLTSETAAGV